MVVVVVVVVVVVIVVMIVILVVMIVILVIMIVKSMSKSKLAGPKAAPLGRKQKQFKICRSSIMQGENYKIPLH